MARPEACDLQNDGLRGSRRSHSGVGRRRWRHSQVSESTTAMNSRWPYFHPQIEQCQRLQGFAPG